MRAARRGALAVLGVLALGACGSSGGTSTTTTASTATTLATTTTTAAATTTTTTGATTSTTAAGPTTTVVAGLDAAPVVTADDAVLKPPADAASLPLDGADPCRVLTGTASLGGCGVVDTGAGSVVWFASDADSPEAPAVQIYRLDGTDLVQTLELPDAVRDDLEPAHVEVADLDGQPGDELVVGIRSKGTGGFLDLEVIGGAGTVVAQRELDHGKAVVGAGGIDTWEAQYGPDEPNCCPGSFQQARIGFAAGAWRMLDVGTVATAKVPAGQFP